MRILLVVVATHLLVTTLAFRVSIELHYRPKWSLALQPDDDAVPKPYAISRGDGSTGGGGVAMRQDERVRPKVGADMPKGRPSWFHVPAPSQGTCTSVVIDVCLFFFC
jgi:hypothetical protein